MFNFKNSKFNRLTNIFRGKKVINQFKYLI